MTIGEYTEFESNFIVMPKDTNKMSPLIFGGFFLEQIDLAAAKCVSRFLYNSKCESAVTHDVHVKFLKPCYLGDLVIIQAKIVSVGKKSIVCKIDAFRERKSPVRDKVATGEIVFVSIKNVEGIKEKPEFLNYDNHGLEIENDGLILS